MKQENNKKSIKEWIYIIILGITILGYGAKVVLLTDQVKRNKANTIELKQKIDNAQIDLIHYRLEEIEIKVDKIYELINEE